MTGSGITMDANFITSSLYVAENRTIWHSLDSCLAGSKWKENCWSRNRELYKINLDTREIFLPQAVCILYSGLLEKECVSKQHC